MKGRTIEVHRVRARNQRTRDVYQIITRREGRSTASVLNITESEAIDLINQLCHAMVGLSEGGIDE